MRHLVISLNPDRLLALDYEFESISGCVYEDTPDWIRRAFHSRYNEHINGHPIYENGEWVSIPERCKFKQRVGCFTAHINALQYIVDHKYDDTVILEDDAQIDREYNFDTSEFPQDSPTLLGASLHHPNSWKKDKEFIINELPDIINEFKQGINKIDYDRFRWAGTFSIYYPKWEVAFDILSQIKSLGLRDFKMGSGPYRHYDIFLSSHQFIKYLHYPSLFTHNDRINKNREVMKGNSSMINGGDGIVKNYLNLGKSYDIVKEHTPVRMLS